MEKSTHPPAANQANAKVAILLAACNGQRYLADQLDSIAAQAHSNWMLWASDDASEDNTRSILESYRSKWGAEKLSIHSGPARGFVANFLSLICNSEIEADYYAFSDQDDVWHPDKLQRALNWLQSVPAEQPVLYCSRSRLVDDDGDFIGFSPLFEKPPSFANALVQNIGSGNTMVFNNAARNILRIAGQDVNIVLHDWWLYQVVSGCGGQVCYDPRPALNYRQHSRNLIGMNSSWPARFRRLHLYWQGDFRNWSDRNIQSLQRIRRELTPTNLEILNRFSAARKTWVLRRLFLLKRSGVYRQTFFENMSLFAAAFLNRI